MTEDALAALMRQYHWPGNVRELAQPHRARPHPESQRRQRLERKHLPMLVFREPSRDASTATPKPARTEEFTTLLQAREAYERDYILKKLDECHGNVSRTAESLGLERSSPLPQDEGPRRLRQGVALPVVPIG